MGDFSQNPVFFRKSGKSTPKVTFGGSKTRFGGPKTRFGTLFWGVQTPSDHRQFGRDLTSKSRSFWFKNDSVIRHFWVRSDLQYKSLCGGWFHARFFLFSSENTLYIREKGALTPPFPCFVTAKLAVYS
jgi:hypothetical protein